jgi:outer membrane protein OmpA-like peptidoglycan-associated protein
MPSVLTGRLVLGLSLGLGIADLAWLDLALAPRVLAEPPPQEEPAPRELAATAGGEQLPEPRIPEPSVDVPEAPGSEAGVATPGEEPRVQVHFASASAWLDREARARVRAVVAAAPKGARFALEGHADPRGADAFNRALSRHRAVAVRDLLVALGVPRGRVRIAYAGAQHATGDELWRDRRVDIQILGGSR